VGFGEATGTMVSPIIQALKVIGATLIGSSAGDTERLWAQYRRQYTHGSVVQAALSAIDIALWDIVGKNLNMPVFDLLGGKVNERIRVYHHPWKPDTIDYTSETKRIVARGIKAGKLDPFRSKGYGRELSSKELTEAVKTIEAIRDAGGPDFILCVEMHARFNVATAIRVAKALEPFFPFFLEEPVFTENVKALREVQRNTTIPIATGEKMRNTAEFVPLLERRACRILQPDIGHMGGITGTKRLFPMADNYYVNIAPHCCWGPVQTIASAHVCASSPNFLIQETVPWLKDIFPDTIVGNYEYDPEYIDLPDGPGLGIELTDHFLKEYKTDPEKWDIGWFSRERQMTGAWNPGKRKES
jgi:galactonate dehydratase